MRIDHEPRPEVTRRAKEAGIDLSALKRDDPITYAMMNAERLLEVHPSLEQRVSERVLAALPDHQIFALPRPADTGIAAVTPVTLLVFPSPKEDELEQLETFLAIFVTEAPQKARYAYYRTVTDPRGEHREVSLPLPFDRWRGEVGVMVGPFRDESAAEMWGQANVATVVYDPIPYGGARFCDVFEQDEV